MNKTRTALVLLAVCTWACRAGSEQVTEFCLHGEYDLGARYQGLNSDPGEWYPASWCVVTEGDTDRVRFAATGNSSPDIQGDWTVAFLPPNRVRIVNADSPPDVEFSGADSLAEARRHRRVDPRRLLMELADHPGWAVADEEGWQQVLYPGESEPVRVRAENAQLLALQTQVDLPLRGRVPIEWRWDWLDPESPRLSVLVDGQTFFRARGSWRSLDPAEAASMWAATPGAEPYQVPGDAWPARIDMERVNLAEGVHVVRTVRTGFHHLVVDTADGLVVADAPAGWIELPQVPPVDMVPGLGISGLSEGFIDFLAAEFPDRPIRAVALTHAHDDHSGGARAFASAGAAVYAPAPQADFLETALNRESMPEDRLGLAGDRLSVTPVDESLTLRDDERPVQLISLGPSPHSTASLGVYVPAQGYFFQSDLHVPRDDSPEPSADRAHTECWFADWATRHLPPHVKVINTHSILETPVERLTEYLGSALCRKLPLPN